MACEHPAPSIGQYPMPARRGYRCLYVGKGPSMLKVVPYLDWGDLATVNDTATSSLLAGKFNQIAFCDGPGFYAKVPQDRTGIIVAPNEVLRKDVVGIKPSIVRFDRRESMARSSIDAVIRDKCPAYFGTPGPSGVVALWLMGYRQIWLFGHDGGVGLAEGQGFADSSTNYDNRRKCIEYMQPLLLREGCDVRFWPAGFAEPCLTCDGTGRLLPFRDTPNIDRVCLCCDGKGQIYERLDA